MPRQSKKLPESVRKREVLQRPMRFRARAAWSHPIPHQHVKKLATIFQHYGFGPGKADWQGLALKLLADYVPGFQFIARAVGRPPKWAPQIELTLVRGIDQLRATGLSVRESCEVIARSKEFRTFGGRARGPSPGTLENRYWKAKRAYSGRNRQTHKK
jgi:hypothetical protein